MVVVVAVLSLPVGRPCTSPLTITLASPSLACCPTSKAKPLSPSCAPPSPSMLSTASPFVACSPTTVPAIALATSAPLALNSASSTASLALHSPHQRQGRTLHSNRIARVGLRSPLLQLRGTRSAPRALARALQLPSPPW